MNDRFQIGRLVHDLFVDEQIPHVTKSRETVAERWIERRVVEPDPSILLEVRIDRDAADASLSIGAHGNAADVNDVDSIEIFEVQLPYVAEPATHP